VMLISGLLGVVLALLADSDSRETFRAGTGALFLRALVAHAVIAILCDVMYIRHCVIPFFQHHECGVALFIIELWYLRIGLLKGFMRYVTISLLVVFSSFYPHACIFPDGMECYDSAHVSFVCYVMERVKQDHQHDADRANFQAVIAAAYARAHPTKRGFKMKHLRARISGMMDTVRKTKASVRHGSMLRASSGHFFGRGPSVNGRMSAKGTGERGADGTADEEPTRKLWAVGRKASVYDVVFPSRRKSHERKDATSIVPHANGDDAPPSDAAQTDRPQSDRAIDNVGCFPSPAAADSADMAGTRGVSTGAEGGRVVTTSRRADDLQVDDLAEDESHAGSRSSSAQRTSRPSGGGGLFGSVRRRGVSTEKGSLRAVPEEGSDGGNVRADTCGGGVSEGEGNRQLDNLGGAQSSDADSGAGIDNAGNKRVRISQGTASKERLQRAKQDTDVAFKAAQKSKQSAVLEPAIEELQDAVFEAEEFGHARPSFGNMLKSAKISLTQSRAGCRSMMNGKK